MQEEACIFKGPNVTLQEVAERPETVERGSNMLAGSDPSAILAAVSLVTRLGRDWMPPRDCVQPAVAKGVVRIVTGHRVPDLAELEWRTGSRL